MKTHFFSNNKLDDGSNFDELVKILSQLFWSIFFIFLVCENCTKVTNQFEMIDNTLCRCNWYILPKEMQKLILIASIYTQQSTVIHGYFDTQCTRESFKGVNAFLFERSQLK